jgi:hypothetical protein
MKTSQRSLIMTSLVVLAIALAGYCLDYQTHEAYRVRDQLFERDLFGSAPLVASPVLIKFGEAIIEPGSVPWVAISGLYPRGNMIPEEAAIGGLLVPFLLLVAAGYLALGRSRAGRRYSGAAPIGAVVEGLSSMVAAPTSLSPPPAWAAVAGRADASDFWFGIAIVASVIKPCVFRAGPALADAAESPEIPEMVLGTLGAQGACQNPGSAPLASGEGPQAQAAC